MSSSFVISQPNIMSLLAAMQPICSKKTSLPVTEYILFDITPRELTLKATDLEISLQSTAEIESTSDENHSFLVPGKRIFELVKELQGDITFLLSGNTLELKADGVDLSLNIKDAQDFPPFPERIENLMQLEAPFLLSLLNKVAFLIPGNNTNVALNGLFLEINEDGMSMVTTDGHSLARIATKKYSLAEEKKWLLPRRAVLEIKKILEVNEPAHVFLGVCGNQLVFSGMHFNFFTKLIAEKFPEYRPVLQKDGFKPARLSRSEFTRTLKRTGCLLAGQFISTTFTFKQNGLDVDLNNKEVGTLKESLPLLNYDGGDIQTRFYSPYLLNGLQALSEETITLHIKNSIKPIMFDAQANEYDFTYLVMPVSVVQKA